MIIGVPKEIKPDEYRVGILPVGVEELTRAGHKVLIEAGAGWVRACPIRITSAMGPNWSGPKEIYGRADMIIKVKEPQPGEMPLLRRGQIVFTYFHLAADRVLTEQLLNTGCIAVAYETLRDDHGRLPLLMPMSEVAGRMSIQEGAKYLERPQMGRGILLAGVPGVEPAHITILGGGVVGANAARVAAGFRASIGLLDINMDRLRYLDDIMPPNVTVIYQRPPHRPRAAPNGRPGDRRRAGARRKSPTIDRGGDLKLMKPGSVIIDVAIDQGGCVATSRPTTHSNPTYLVNDVVHYCVTNMPGAVGRTSTFALCNVTLPWALQIANRGLLPAASALPPVARAINLFEGEVTNRAVAETFAMPYNPRFEV